MANASQFSALQTVFSRLNSAAGRIARFCYTDTAFANKDIEGVQSYDFTANQNIPLATQTDTEPAVLDKGVRVQGASIARMFHNHFIGRASYNVNMIVDQLLAFFGLLLPYMAHNAAEYDASADYSVGDVCYLIVLRNNRPTKTIYQRSSTSPATIRNIPPPNATHWKSVSTTSMADVALLYDATIEYGQNALCYTTQVANNQMIVTWYQRISTTPTAITGISPPDATHWRKLRDQTSLAQPIAASASLRDYQETGLYVPTTTAAVTTITDLPYIPAGYPSKRIIQLNNAGAADITVQAGIWSVLSSATGALMYTVQLASDVVVAAGNQVKLEFVATTNGIDPAKSTYSGVIASADFAGSYPWNTNLEAIDHHYIDGSPPITDFTLRVIADLTNSRMVVQELVNKTSGWEHTRIIQGNTTIIPWYKSKDPVGLNIVGVPGLWAFRIEADRHLYLYYGDNDPVPPLTVIRDPTHPLNGHLIWELP